MDIFEQYKLEHNDKDTSIWVDRISYFADAKGGLSLLTGEDYRKMLCDYGFYSTIAFEKIKTVCLDFLSLGANDTDIDVVKSLSYVEAAHEFVRTHYVSDNQHLDKIVIDSMNLIRRIGDFQLRTRLIFQFVYDGIPIGKLATMRTEDIDFNRLNPLTLELHEKLNGKNEVRFGRVRLRTEVRDDPNYPLRAPISRGRLFDSVRDVPLSPSDVLTSGEFYRTYQLCSEGQMTCFAASKIARGIESPNSTFVRLFKIWAQIYYGRTLE